MQGNVEGSVAFPWLKAVSEMQLSWRPHHLRAIASIPRTNTSASMTNGAAGSLR